MKNYVDKVRPGRGTDWRITLALIVAVFAIAGVLAVAFASIAAADENGDELDELVNESVDFNESAELELKFVVNESIDGDDTEADVEFFGADDWDDDGADGDPALEDSVTLEENETVTETWNASEESDLDDESEYRVLVFGDGDEIDDASVASDNGGFWGGVGGADGSPGFGGIAALAAVKLLVVGALLARGRS